MQNNAPFNSKKFFTSLFIVLALLLVLSRLLDQWLIPVLRAGLAAAVPFIIGLVLAYLLRFAINPLERLILKLFKVKKPSRLIRIISITVVMLLFLGALVALLWGLIPSLYRNLADLAGRVPGYLEQIANWADDVIAQSGLQFSQNAAEMINTLAQKIGEHLSSHAEEYAQMASRTIFGFIGTLVDCFLGILVAFYLLTDTHRYKRLLSRIITVFISDTKKQAGIKRFLRETDGVLGKYITGRLIETAILGVLCFIGLSIFGVDYSLIMAVTVALTNLIPYFGPWLGAIPVLLLAFLNNPDSAIWIAIFLLALQIIDNYIVSPKILGDMLEVSALWILVGVILGGGMFGVWGMILGAPAMSILSGLWNRFFKWRASEQAKKDGENGPAL